VDEEMRETSNTQHPTSNIQWKDRQRGCLRHWMFGVGGWTLDVLPFP
jgi:hypothetical protein